MRCFTLLFILGFIPSQNLLAEEDLFRFGKRKYQSSDLEAKYQLQIFEAEMQAFQQKERILEEAILELHFLEQAKKSQKSVESLQKEALEVNEPTEEELRTFYQNNRKKIPYPFEQIRSELVRFVSNQKMESRRAELLEKLKNTGNYKSLLSMPKMPVLSIPSEKFFKRGKAESKIQLVEFADYQCPHCSSSAAAMEKAYERFGKQVEFVFIDFPVLQGISRRLAEAAYCAGQQNKYWEYHKLLFENQSTVKEQSIEEFAKQLNLDKSAFQACLDSAAPGKFIDMSKQEGQRLGVTGTPSVFINGRRILQRISLDLLVKEIEAQLK
ncbi:MAG: DsbA family protein [Oligoflexus sp.]